VTAAAGLREETMNEKYVLQDEQLQNAGTLYALVNIGLFLLPLIGIFYFIHFFCYKDSLGKRRRLVWAMNLIMIYSVLICIFHMAMMTRIFGFVGMLLSIQTLVYNVISFILFFWWRKTIVRHYRDWTSIRAPKNMVNAVRKAAYLNNP